MKRDSNYGHIPTETNSDSSISETSDSSSSQQRKKSRNTVSHKIPVGKKQRKGDENEKNRHQVQEVCNDTRGIASYNSTYSCPHDPKQAHTVGRTNVKPHIRKENVRESMYKEHTVPQVHKQTGHKHYLGSRWVPQSKSQRVQNAVTDSKSVTSKPKGES